MYLYGDYEGSSENGSSGNLGIPAARGFDVNKLPAAGEEVSSANSPFSLYRNTRNGNLQLGGGGNKRDLEATLNDAARALSDDDENALNARKKLRLSKEQSAFLEESFKEHNTLNPVSNLIQTEFKQSMDSEFSTRHELVFVIIFICSCLAETEACAC